LRTSIAKTEGGMQKPDLLGDITRRIMQWLGHVIRMDTEKGKGQDLIKNKA
jgi:hypothetical protein